MERHLRLESPSLADGRVDSGDELTRSNSDLSYSNAESYCRDLSLPSVNENLDEHTTWTDEKHNLYLNQLEVSFVKQLHQKKHLFMKFSETNLRDIDASQKQPVNVHNASEQINYEGNQALSRTSADSSKVCKSPWMYHSKQIDQQCPSSVANKQHFHGKRIVSQGLAACSQESFAKNRMREGFGQNFVEEDNLYNLESQAKWLKNAVANVTSYDQILPSTRCTTTDYSKVATSDPGEEHGEFMSRNF